MISQAPILSDGEVDILRSVISPDFLDAELYIRATLLQYSREDKTSLIVRINAKKGEMSESIFQTKATSF